MQGITRWLSAIDSGDGHGAEELLPLVYDDLRRLAAQQMASQQPGHTLQPTALVHEAWVRLAAENHGWESRRHFFAAAAEAMRRILVDQARRRKRLKRGGDQEHADLDSIDVAMEATPEDILRVHEALDDLAAEDPVKADLVKLRFFVGLRIPEAAEILGISPATAKRHWAYSRAWLYDALKQIS